MLCLCARYKLLHSHSHGEARVACRPVAVDCHPLSHMQYSYYLITSLGFRPSWKPLLTAAQLLQFVVILVHALYHLLVVPGLCWSPFVSWVELGLMVQMLLMFGDFFISSYGSMCGKRSGKKPRAKGEGAGSGEPPAAAKKD